MAVVASVLVSVAYANATTSHAATASAPSSALPLYEFADTGTEPLPWNAQSLESELSGTTMIGGPHGATNGDNGVLAYRTNTNDLATLSLSATGAPQWTDWSLGNNVPPPEADPVPFYDPSGHVALLYVDTSGDLIILTANEAATPAWNHWRYGAPWRPVVATDLSALTGVAASSALASVAVSGSTATVSYLTSTNSLEVLTLTYSGTDPIPIYNQVDATLSAPNSSTTTTTTTTTTPASGAPSSNGGFSNPPIVLPGPTATVASTLANGDLVVFTQSGPSPSPWVTQDVTTLTGASPIDGALALGATSSTIDVAALTGNGAVELFSTYYPPASASSPVPSAATDSWSVQNITALASGAPPLAGNLTVQVTPSQVAIAGQAAHWGDLFVLTNAVGTSSWTATDVSVTAGSAARTVGAVVTGLQVNGQLTLYAAGVNSPPPQGVGVYAIPWAKWTTAITQGWPIISETGGLGTQSAPWVGLTSASSVSQSPDFLMGQAIYNSHKRVTWLSFWTVSGPLAGQSQSPTNYYDHGFASGVWVGTQIASYRSLGVGITPDWVILDPEGYPDNHSHLDAPPGASPATLARFATYWAAMLKGWQAGLDSVDPALNAGVYASQSEYRNYQLANLPLPVFVAVAFSGGGPVPVAGASGSNVRGFISFGASCTPAATLASEANTLANPPWSGEFNTLQFNAGVYCAPP